MKAGFVTEFDASMFLPLEFHTFNMVDCSHILRTSAKSTIGLKGLHTNDETLLWHFTKQCCACNSIEI